MSLPDQNIPEARTSGTYSVPARFPLENLNILHCSSHPNHLMEIVNSWVPAPICVLHLSQSLHLKITRIIVFSVHCQSMLYYYQHCDLVLSNNSPCVVGFLKDKVQLYLFCPFIGYDFKELFNRFVKGNFPFINPCLLCSILL